jgi:hypothetical protein
MYIHRVAIDVNRVNARGKLSAMNNLEQMHDACLIEIVCTSTMATDLHHYPAGTAKVKKYDRIHAEGIFYLTGTQLADATPGPVLRKSRFYEIYESVFGGSKPQQSELQLRSMRDALHIDQCWSNMVDYFVTEEKDLHRCQNMDFVICDAPECVERLRTYFRKTLGTDDIVQLSKMLAEHGPIILGSNCTGAFECRVPNDDDPLLRVEISPAEISVSCTIRDDQGRTLLRVLPAQEYEFAPRCDASVDLLAGPFPIQLGKQHCKSFAITSDKCVFLAGRFVRPGRLVLFEASLRATDGTEALVIRRSGLGLCRCSFIK